VFGMCALVHTSVFVLIVQLMGRGMCNRPAFMVAGMEHAAGMLVREVPASWVSGPL